MRWHDFEVAGETYHFCMNGAALFDLYDRFGDKDPILSHIEGQTRRAFDATCFMLAKLAEQGELVRRFQGHKPEKIPTEAWFRTNLAPLDVSAAKLTVQAVVRLGFKREEPDEDENDADGVDLGLQELEKKTANA